MGSTGEYGDTGELLLALARRMRREFLEATREHGVTPTQARALRVLLRADESLRPSVLAHRLRMAPRTVTELLDGLQGAGLVDRSPDPGDRRALLVAPTDRGRRLGLDLDTTRRDVSQQILGRLSRADHQDLHRILTGLTEVEGDVR